MENERELIKKSMTEREVEEPDIAEAHDTANMMKVLAGENTQTGKIEGSEPTKDGYDYYLTVIEKIKEDAKKEDFVQKAGFFSAKLASMPVRVLGGVGPLLADLLANFSDPHFRMNNPINTPRYNRFIEEIKLACESAEEKLRSLQQSADFYGKKEQ